MRVEVDRADEDRVAGNLLGASASALSCSAGRTTACPSTSAAALRARSSDLERQKGQNRNSCQSQFDVHRALSS